jgi:hypothetical protein
MHCRQILTISALFLGALAFQSASAQELSVNPSALDTSVGAKAASRKSSKTRGLGAQQRAKSDGKPGKAPDRQFGELEGWSPGKAPPGQKKEETESRFSNSKLPVGVSPSGGMSVGLPF